MAETVKTDQPVQAIGTVEKRSYDYVPLNERHGKPRHLFSVWFGENIQILAVVTGSIGVVLGLGLAWTLVAIVAGNVVGQRMSLEILHHQERPRPPTAGVVTVAQADDGVVADGAIL